MSATLEISRQENLNDFQGRLQRNQPLTERNSVRVVVTSRQAGRLNIPAQTAPNAAKTVGHHRLAVTRATEHDGTIAFPACDGLSRRTNESRIVTTLLAVGAEVSHLVTPLNQKLLDPLFVSISRMV